MQFEVIRKSYKKEIVIGISLFIMLAIVLIVRFTFAKYSLVKSIKIAEGTINYKVPDFKIMAMYKQKDDATCTEDNCYNEMSENEVMPESGYTINESKSYCTLDNTNKDTKAKLFTNEEGKHVISGLSKADKCYLYFDKKVLTAGEVILSNVTVNEGTPDFGKTAQTTCSDASTCETTTGVYKAEDNDGTSYYFRGAVENNYVKFGKNSSNQDMYWRIIRINGDGTIRLIYDGTSAHTNGTSTSDSIAVTKVKWSHKDAYWNSSTDNAYTNNNAYVGFRYTLGELHGIETKSNALEELEAWYINNLAGYESQIDSNADFCGDRTPYLDREGTTSGGGTGTTETFYGSYIRLKSNKLPNLKCANASDLYTVSGSKSLTYPIGLISADEVSMAGGVNGIANKSYYLYNGNYYWTMSPFAFYYIDIVEADIFLVYTNGKLVNWTASQMLGLRPVINLRSDVKLTGKGSMTNPYIVN